MLEKTNSGIAPQEIINAIITLYHKKKYKDVLHQCFQLIEKYPSTYSLYNIIGAIFFEKRDLELAAKFFRKVINLRPNHSHGYNNLGATLIDLEKYQEALTVFHHAIKLDPNYAEAYNNIGNAYHKLKKYSKAIKNYKRAIMLNSTYYEAFNNLGVALGKNKKFKVAEKVLKKVILMNPTFADGYNSLGNILNNLQKYHEAEKVLKKVILMKPEFVDGYNSLGDVLTNLQKFDEAEKILKHAMILSSVNADTYFNLGLLYSKKNSSKIAINFFLKALNFDPENANIYYNLGINFTQVGLLKKATENFKKCLELDPSHKNALHLYNSVLGRKTTKAPNDYVIDLFNYYAKNFEKSLIYKLDYKVPKEIKNLLLGKSLECLGSIADLGCGTGLVGSELKNYCNYMEGIDLSNYMLHEAKKKKIYDRLIQTEIINFLKKYTLNFDYFIAADVFIYVGNLNQVFRLIKERNKKSGNLIFSTEHTTGDSYILKRSGRYAHSKNYIKHLCNKFNFSIIEFHKIKLRKEKNKYIVGGLYNLKF